MLFRSSARSSASFGAVSSARGRKAGLYSMRDLLGLPGGRVFRYLNGVGLCNLTNRALNDQGGALYFDEGTSVIRNSTFTSNTADDDNGGLYGASDDPADHDADDQSSADHSVPTTRAPQAATSLRSTSRTSFGAPISTMR